ncbi:hypothetical protein ABZ345_05640 [Lentzea sp. NPDC005914]|uniref:hypothetical protein n=1 Tax=Lentzea sp. NPDC005914 TaxID=3154572 RepID=UPI0033F54659
MSWTNEVSGRVDGPVVQVGVLVGDVHVDTARPTRSAYLAQVRALAPDSLEGRSYELAVLTAFCSSEATAESYLWWRAEAWSGKSALLAWFVLHPPPDVHVVSFFVTSRLPGQNDRRGFVDCVLEQLHDLAECPPRTDLTDATREPYLRQLLVDMASRIRAQGKHFVLVVDGLDEDRGLDGSADAHSIAALLPHRGVRVVVAGRPDPALPADVRTDHPLHTSARVEQLTPSPEASAVHDVMTRDLKRLMRGSQVQQDLLGFVTAAGGGLSARDLAELTGASQWQVKDDLRTTAGRSFARRPGEPPVYLLAHDQLHVLAVEMLGPRLRSYQERLAEWASTYRARGWPPDTPRHLLQGHAALLAATGHRQRLLDYVIDLRRQNAAHAMFGNNNASVTEIETAQAVFLGDDEPDLTALARLAVHRTNLQDGGDWVPASLPRIWVRAGRVDHAQVLIASISDPIARTRALMGTAEELHRAGQPDLAARMFDTAEALTLAFNQFWGDWLHRELAEAATRAGDLDRTQRVIDHLHSADSQAQVCASAALTALSAADREHAERWYQDAEEALASEPASKGLFGTTAKFQAHALVFATTAAAAAALGRQDRAAELAATATDPESTYELRTRAQVVSVVEMLAQGGFVETALSVAEKHTDVEDPEDALLCIAQTLAHNGELDKAEALARTTTEARYRCAALATVAFAAGRGTEQERANQLRTEVESILEGLPPDDCQQIAVRTTAVAAADAGQHDQAENTVFTQLLPGKDFDGALYVAFALLRRGENDRAERVIEATEHAARSTSRNVDERALLQWIDVMTDFGDVDRAEPLVRTLQDPEIRAAAWQRLAETIAATGDLRRFQAAFDHITQPSLQQRPRLEMIRVLLADDEKDEAVRLARTSDVIRHRAKALDFIAGATRDREMLDEVIALATDATGLDEQAGILDAALRTAADLGDRATAELLLRRLHLVQDQLSAEAKRNGGHARTVYLPERLRTLTELAEQLGRFPHSYLRDDEEPSVRSGAPTFFVGSSPLPFRTQFARALAIGGWMDIVDRIVEEDPDVYAAIICELDRIEGQGSRR